MSLVSFHRALIAVAILFCLGYGGWEIAGFTRDGSTGSLLIGVAFLLLGFALLYYLVHLKDFLRRK